MQLFDYSMLILERLNAQGLPVIQTYLMSGTVILACLVCLCMRVDPRHRPGPSFSGTDIAMLGDYRSAWQEFDREVEAWQEAVRQNGGHV